MRLLFVSKDQNGSRFYQYLTVALVALMIINAGMLYGWSSPSIEKLQHPDSSIPVTNDEGSWLAVMPLMGSLLGASIASFTIDIMGRKKSILYTTIPFFASWLMIAFARSVLVLYIARFIAGAFESVVFAAAGMYLGEISDPRIRGLLLSSMSIDRIFGVLLINVFGFYFSIKTAAIICSIPPLLCLASFIWMPETPYGLLMKRNLEGARKSLQTFRGRQDVEPELNRIGDAIKQQMTNTGKFFDLFTVKSNRKATYIVLLLRTAQQLSGTAAITFYTQTIFKETDSSIPPEIATFAYIAVQLSMCMISPGIIDKVGRRPLLLVSAFGSAVALCVQGTYFYIKTNTDIDTSTFSYVPIIALIGFVIIFSLGMQTVPIILLGELFPANVKAFAFCMVDIYFSIIATLVSKFFQYTKDNYGMYVPFYSFTLSCTFGLVLMYFVVPETKGKTLEELQMYLKGDNGQENNNSSKLKNPAA